MCLVLTGLLPGPQLPRRELYSPKEFWAYGARWRDTTSVEVYLEKKFHSNMQGPSDALTAGKMGSYPFTILEQAKDTANRVRASGLLERLMPTIVVAEDGSGSRILCSFVTVQAKKHHQCRPLLLKVESISTVRRTPSTIRCIFNLGRKHNMLGLIVLCLPSSKPTSLKGI